MLKAAAVGYRLSHEIQPTVAGERYKTWKQAGFSRDVAGDWGFNPAARRVRKLPTSAMSRKLMADPSGSRDRGSPSATTGHWVGGCIVRCGILVEKREYI